MGVRTVREINMEVVKSLLADKFDSAANYVICTPARALAKGYEIVAEFDQAMRVCKKPPRDTPPEPPPTEKPARRWGWPFDRD